MSLLMYQHIAITAAVYIDSEVAKNTPEQLKEKSANATKKSASLYKAHGLLGKAGNIKIDDSIQEEVRSKTAPKK